MLRTRKRIEETGLHETAHRALSVAAAIYRYAIATGAAMSNPADALIDALASVAMTHHAVIDPRRVGELLLDFESYHGKRTTRIGSGAIATLLVALAVRSGMVLSALAHDYHLHPVMLLAVLVAGAGGAPRTIDHYQLRVHQIRYLRWSQAR